MFVKTRAVALRRAGDSKREVQRVKVATPCIERPPEIGVCCNEGANLVPLNVTHGVVAVFVAQLVHIGTSMRTVGRLVIRVQVTGAVVAIDRIGLDQPVKMGARIDRKVPKLPRGSHSEFFFKPVLVASQADVNLPAVATGRTPAQ